MKTLQTPAVVTSISSRQDGSLRFSTETPEYTNDEKAVFFDLQGKNVKMTIEPTDEASSEVVEVTSEAEPKSRSQKLRSVLYVLWSQSFKEKYPTFTDFYNKKYDEWIEAVKDKLI